MLYIALISCESIIGGASLSSSLLIRSVPKTLFCIKVKILQNKKELLSSSFDLLAYRAAFADSTRAVNAAASETAISASIFLLRSMPAFLRPFINVE